jgi:hypothetical protein
VAVRPRIASMPHSPATLGCRPGSAGDEAGLGPTIQLPVAPTWLVFSF